MPESAVALAPGPVRVAVIVLALLNVVGAVGGGVMLMGPGLGNADITTTRLGPLGFTSWAPGGVLLILGVAAPMALVGTLLWMNHPWGPLIALLAGLALVCWIITQVTLLGFVSWLQPLYFVIGVAVAGGGMLLVRAS